MSVTSLWAYSAQYPLSSYSQSLMLQWKKKNTQNQIIDGEGIPSFLTHTDEQIQP